MEAPLIEQPLQDDLDAFEATRAPTMAHIKREEDTEIQLPVLNSFSSQHSAADADYSEEFRSLLASYSTNTRNSIAGQIINVPLSVPQNSLPDTLYQRPQSSSSARPYEQDSLSYADHPYELPSPAPSATWYKQPSSVIPQTLSNQQLSGVHQTSSGRSSSEPPHPESLAAGRLSRVSADSEKHVPHTVFPSVTSSGSFSTASSRSNGCMNSKTALSSADYEEKPPIMIEDELPEVKQTMPLTGTDRQVSRGAADRVESTARQLRTRQSFKVQQQALSDHEQKAEVSENSSLDFVASLPLTDEESEILPPPAQVLKPRRQTRKPHHTQRMWRPDIQGEPSAKWREIGQAQGLSSDTEIAVFLMQHYENAMSGQPMGVSCVNCTALLTFTCMVCHVPSQFVKAPKSSPTGSDVATVPVTFEEALETKTEPIDVVPSDAEPQSLEVNPEEREGEKKRKTKHSKRGRPVGSGKKKAGSRASRGGRITNGISKACFDSSSNDLEKGSNDLENGSNNLENGSNNSDGGNGHSRKLENGSFDDVGTACGIGADDANTSTLNNRRFKCTYDGCEAAFAKASRLKIHYRIHTGEKPFVCQECGKAFTQKSGLTVHMQKHSGLRPFNCAECNATFPSSSTLKQHMRRHTGEKPFACKKCDKTFRWSGHLTQHMRMHDGIKPFLCPDCGKSFASSSDLVKHRVTHTKSRPYKCDLCNKAYSFQHRLTAHQRSHTGDRPFLCSKCGAAFSRAHNLTVHMRTHTGDKPYQCNDCGAKFSDSGNFCKHKKTKHGEYAKLSYSKARDSSALADIADHSDLMDDLGVGKLSEYEPLLDITRLPDYNGTDSGKLPSMEKVAGIAKIKRESSLRDFLPVGSVALNSLLPQSHMLPSARSTLSPQQSELSPTCSDDLKSLLTHSGNKQSSNSLPITVQLESPPTPVHNRLSASPAALSPAVSILSQGSPGSSGSNDSKVSPVPQPADQMDYQIPQHDGVVFPQHYYTSTHPYLYQQQQQQ